MKKYPEKRDLGESLLGVVSEAPSREKTAACRAPRCVAGLISLAPVAAAGERLQSLASPALELPSEAFFWGGEGEGRSLLPPARAGCCKAGAVRGGAPGCCSEATRAAGGERSAARSRADGLGTRAQGPAGCPLFVGIPGAEDLASTFPSGWETTEPA